MLGFGGKRKEVYKIREKQRKEAMRLNRDLKEAQRREQRAEFERKQLASQTRSIEAETKMHKAEVARKKAKHETRWSAGLPSLKLSAKAPTTKRKKQGKKLTQKRRIGLF